MSRWLRMIKRMKHLDPVGHPECEHNWIHNAGEQCDWDSWSFSDSIKGVKPQDYVKDSDNVAYIYTCTQCGESFWSSTKVFDIPHYRVREVKDKCQKKKK